MATEPENCSMRKRSHFFSLLKLLLGKGIVPLGSSERRSAFFSASLYRSNRCLSKLTTFKIDQTNGSGKYNVFAKIYFISAKSAYLNFEIYNKEEEHFEKN
ncbi:hypothetical protein BpHYR1_049277 [Brachionus plicatilis]|uniref:Uncharacterized protein n=1 Tax=Brachionus plicatilis TaxID=10195 RepID=A0A3M7RZY3_BRAPC|nr:hypothetical protein BpHYR1_049277 [Brachionus plicatilis]